jgi:hypothetical protein
METDRSRKSVLFLMDTKNLHYSLTNLYNPSARIDFKKLKNLAANGAGFIRSIAYVGTYKKDSEKFLVSLSKLGFEVVFFEKSATEIMAQTIRENADTYDEIVVSSGAGSLNEVYKDYPGKARVLAFADSLHRETKNYADVTVLTADILMTPLREQTTEPEAKIRLNPIEVPNSEPGGI